MRASGGDLPRGFARKDVSEVLAGKGEEPVVFVGRTEGDIVPARGVTAPCLQPR